MPGRAISATAFKLTTASLAATAAVALAACPDARVNHDTGGSAGASTASSTSSSTSTGGTSSSGSASSSSSGGTTCATASTCPGTDTECKKRACDGGSCGFTFIGAGTAIASQTVGDCNIAVCDGAGDVGSMPDDDDKQSDNDECITSGCNAGSPTHTPVAEGTPCVGSGGAKVCSAAGQCVECVTGSDCASNLCEQNTCIEVLLISELQTRGSAGGGDEFLEIFNPNNHPVTFGAGWDIWTRSANSSCTALTKRLTGAGQVIPAHGHLLFTNNTPTTGYDGPVAGDATYTTGYGDSGQVVLLHGGTLVDSLCYYYNAATQANLTCSTPPAIWFACQGAVSNLPHNDGTSGPSNSDISIERRPGGAAGNGQSTGDNAADFVSNAAPNPQNTQSASTP